MEGSQAITKRRGVVPRIDRPQDLNLTCALTAMPYKDPEVRRAANRDYDKKYYHNASEEQRLARQARLREYYQANRERIRARASLRHEANPDLSQHKRDKEAARYALIRDAVSEHKRQYYIQNRDAILARGKAEQAKQLRAVRDRQRYVEDPQVKLTRILRRRLNHAVKSGRGGAIAFLGCSVAQAIDYLASKFQPGMSWANWGLHGWHIDHVMPLSAFDLTDDTQRAAACHYTNLQPLWAADNLRKRAVDLTRAQGCAQRAAR